MIYGLSAYQCVAEFHETFGQYVGKTAEFPDDDTMALRRTLIEEELKEFLDEVEKGDFIAAVKELADLLYVVNGTAVVMGLDGDEIVQMVHKSNMTKLDDDGKAIFREDGKVLKSKNYKPVTREVIEHWIE